MRVRETKSVRNFFQFFFIRYERIRVFLNETSNEEKKEMVEIINNKNRKFMEEEKPFVAFEQRIYNF